MWKLLTRSTDVSALEALKRELEHSKRIRKQNIIELKNSYAFETGFVPKLRNKLFQALSKRKYSGDLKKNS